MDPDKIHETRKKIWSQTDTPSIKLIFLKSKKGLKKIDLLLS